MTAASGITFVNTTGDPDRKDYIFEVKGGGVGALDYDNDGWVDLVFSRGSSLERWRQGDEPRARPLPQPRRRHLRGRHAEGGPHPRGLGRGRERRRLRQRRLRGPLPDEPRPDVLYRNNGDGTFTDVTEKAGIRAPGWSSSAAFGDFDRDGYLDLYVASYLDVGPDKLPEGRAGGTCSYLGVPVLCGPRGLPGARDLYFHNNGDGTFTEQSEASGAFDKEAYFGLGVVASDVDGDGDLDLYVGNDATPNYLFVNRGDGRFDERGFPSGIAVSGDGNEQASMGVDAADYDNDGRPDLYATHFASDYSTLYRNLGGLLFEDVTARARIKEPGLALVKWGTGFVDLDQDGWKDIVHANGHVYPHLREAAGKETYEQPALTRLPSTTGTGRSATPPPRPDPDATKRVLGRGTAFADLDNDGDLDVVVACLDGTPLVLRNDTAGGHWLQVRAVGRRRATATGSAPASPCGRASSRRSARSSARWGSTRRATPARTSASATATRPTSCGWSGRAGRWTSSGTCRPTGTTSSTRRRGSRPSPPAGGDPYLTSTQWRPTYSRPFVNCSGTGWASAASHCAAASPTLAPATS